MKDRSLKVRLFIEKQLSQDLDIALSANQAKYLFKVMRLNIGQIITVFDGKTGEYEARIREKGIRTGKICILKKTKTLIVPPRLQLRAE